MSGNHKYRILFIDDEQANLRVFHSTFRWEYEVFTAPSGEEANTIMYSEKIDLIITDQRMPGMTGVEFLEQIVVDFPDVPRILMTGYSDIESIIEAINKVKIFQYITKPWEKEQVQYVIENAIEEAQLKIKNENLLNDLTQTNTHLTSALKELDSFIYKASHDLMSPITTILGLVNLTQMEQEVKEKDKYLKKIDTTAKRMKYFLSHLSIVNMIQDKNVELKSVNLHSTLEQYSSYSRKNFTIEVNVAEDIECTTDEVLLNIAISQIIENSLKFSHPGRASKAWIEVAVVNNEIVLTISDNGVGINKEYTSQYFNMFFKGGNSPGNGIGLYLAKKVIERLQGKIWIDGQVDEGTTVMIQLPLNKSNGRSELILSKNGRN